MTTPILVTGGTGTLGRHVVPRLREAGFPVRVLSRRARDGADGIEYVAGDLNTGHGVDQAVKGVETIVHLAGTNKGDDDKVRAVIAAARRTGGEPHIVNISVVGAERVPVVSAVDRAMFGYFASKRAAEIVVAESGLPWTNLRATQFHDLCLLVARGIAKSPLIPLPSGVRFQPVDTDEVAARMVELALAGPAGQVPDIAGPRIYPMREMIAAYLAVTRKRRLFVPLPLGGRAYQAVRAGANIAPGRAVGVRTWEEFLVDRVPQPAL
jgi:uncharacterized protein YbjT (DUF2867 family)